MTFMPAGSQRWLGALAVACVVLATGTAARAQEAAPPAAGAVTVSGGIEFANQYVFRGVPQNSTGLVVWPSASLTWHLFSGDALVRGVNVGVGSWNSVHTGDTGSGGPADRSWYESRVSGAVGLQFGRGVSVTSTYTAYVSPNEVFGTVKEIGVTAAVDDRGALGRAALRPYALIAFEIDTSPGIGQLDGGMDAGRYLEFGATPGYAGRRAGIEFPVKVGLSLGGYYELGPEEPRFGFVSVGGRVTVPVGPRSRVGQWSVHGGVEYHSLGDTARAFNAGERSAVAASGGLVLKPW